MKTMCDTNNGFEIAEIDLKLRGPGDLAGTQQSGIMNLHIADLTKDIAILEITRQEATKILLEDPHLQKAENAFLIDQLDVFEKQHQNFARVS
jgi:ATP-dependent DNA helicase RecG